MNIWRFIKQHHCQLCGLDNALAGTNSICLSCLQQLPWLEHYCWHCAEPLGYNSQDCGRCLQQPPAFWHAWAAMQFYFPAQQLIHNFKFQGQLHHGRTLAEIMGHGLRQHLAERAEPPPNYLLAMPLHPSRQAERGFNQAQLLSQDLSHILGINQAPLRWVNRQRATAEQALLGRDDRYRNMRKAFVTATNLSGRIAIIDDVITTGATTSALARCLLDAGAESVEVWCAAKAGAAHVS